MPIRAKCIMSNFKNGRKKNKIEKKEVERKRRKFNSMNLPKNQNTEKKKKKKKKNGRVDMFFVGLLCGTAL